MDARKTQVALETRFVLQLAEDAVEKRRSDFQYCRFENKTGTKEGGGATTTVMIDDTIARLPRGLI